MNLDDYRTLFVAVSLVLILVSTVPVISVVMPRNAEPFFAMGVLGENMMAEQYYPGDDPDIRVGSLVRWHLGVYNHMGSVQYVAVRVKLLNSTLSSPNSLECIPSSESAFVEFRNILASNETWWFPFYWSISEVMPKGDSLVITQLVVNNMTVGLNAQAFSGYNFRVVFELWAHDEALQGFDFAWKSGQEDRCVWNQIWFNVTLSE